MSNTKTNTNTNTAVARIVKTAPTITDDIRSAMSTLGIKNKEFRRGLWYVKDLTGVKGAPQVPATADRIFYRDGCILFYIDKSGDIHTNTALKETDDITQTILDLFAYNSTDHSVNVYVDKTLAQPTKSGGACKYTSDFFKCK